MNMKTETAPAAKSGQLLTPSDYNTARAAGLNVNWPAESVFNNAVARFAVAVREPMLARIEVLEGSVKASAEEVVRLKALLQKIVNEDADDEGRLRDELIGEARELIAKFQPAIIHLPADDTEGGGL